MGRVKSAARELHEIACNLLAVLALSACVLRLWLRVRKKRV